LGVLGVQLEQEQSIATVLGYVIGFTLMAVAPLSVLAVAICKPRKLCLIRTGFLWVFLAALWFEEAEDAPVTIAFSAYVVAVLLLWLSQAMGKHTRKHPS
jgi:hypothetical protein